ncbi:MAG: hypothetical protein JGK12_21245 [Microcoleus sp. PH2017_01_SCD_O_A]|uniref:hypothetical protein n=1 Tax=Microcoleus sp. PH2017_01_SCD_O_A TaxID=2798812 RepID=UPI001D696432|nr:hypothetical protein [Microcoleus sp. PH2017_01_SCD_O_A]MCC3432692.1 hypothetical protein [Microcoleus sp. PH2017_04_SCI_O_A]TAE67471.1 MAG: hypothetical protein EAZ86_16110 [Oscillatoriales cyanobacterium]MCC3426366.1 hypothetical protein [Microcoleus sp. PH2017_01_SCD_O_A]TAG67491.1 MAG: hypothetical protein EAZ25_07305 [Oscillatoriales cyanobacterium]TAH31042.1 MAG: hypothetical protein EAZ10_01935 [Oscillatoriales cyanobacterium]
MKAEFYYDCHRYICSLVQVDFVKELKIKNHQGFVLAVKQGEKIGLLGKSRHNAKQVDVSKPHFYNVIKAAMSALELETRNEVILERNRTIADGEEMIQQQNREIRVLNEQLRIQSTQIEHLSRENQQLSVQLVEKEIRETQISQEIEEDLVAEIDDWVGESEISEEIDELPILDSGFGLELIEHQQDLQDVEKAEEISGGEVEVLDLEIVEQVDVPADNEIKHLAKRGSQRKMRKK